MRKLLHVSRGLFAAATLGVLAFGASSVLVEPAEAAARGECRPRACRDACVAAGFSGGVCNYMDMSCDCIY